VQGPLVRGSLPQSLVLTSDYAAFQQQRLLTAVDPLTGQTLWLRDDQPGGADLFGDRELVLSVPAGSTTAVVLNARDGRELGTREVPDKDKRLAVFGRTFVTWERAGDKQLLQRFDPWKQAAEWSSDFAPKSQAWITGNNQVAVMEPEGRFVILSLGDGRTVLETTVDAEPDLQSICVLPAGQRYILIANRPEPKIEGPVFWNRNMPGQIQVEGKVYGLDARTGKRLWMTEVTQQWIKVNHPPQSPVLAFFRRHQRAIKGPNNSWRSDQPHVLLCCLDSRNGKILHQSEIKNSHDQSYGFAVDPAEGEVRVQSRLERVTFRYRPGEATPDLIEGEDPNKPGDPNDPSDATEEEVREKLKAAAAAAGARIDQIEIRVQKVQRIEKNEEKNEEKDEKKDEQLSVPVSTFHSEGPLRPGSDCDTADAGSL
jgi:outer membrane protein assembly factor BamB